VLTYPNKLRLGAVNHSNAEPLLAGMEVRPMRDNPTVVTHEFLAGRLDAVLAPAAMILENPADWQVVDGVSIACDGEVWSVLVQSTLPLSRLAEVAPHPSSRSSNLLLRCLAASGNLIQGQRISVIEDSEEARLIIADEALTIRERGIRQDHTLDLGQAWKKWTGLPFVFALWVLRADLPNQKEIADFLRASAALGKSSLESYIDHKQFANVGEHYFRRCLSYELGPSQKRGLEEFAMQCRNFHLIPEGTRWNYV
jgi:chorismate dehydratase